MRHEPLELGSYESEISVREFGGSDSRTSARVLAGGSGGGGTGSGAAMYGTYLPSYPKSIVHELCGAKYQSLRSKCPHLESEQAHSSTMLVFHTVPFGVPTPSLQVRVTSSIGSPHFGQDFFSRITSGCELNSVAI